MKLFHTMDLKWMVKRGSDNLRDRVNARVVLLLMAAPMVGDDPS